MPCRQRRPPVELAWRLCAQRRTASPFRRRYRPDFEGELIGNEGGDEADSARRRPEEGAWYTGNNGGK
jgi:hypothetical protein